MGFNKYQVYGFQPYAQKTTTNTKIYDEIEAMKTIKEYKEIVSFIESHYGPTNKTLIQDCGDKMKLFIGEKKNIIEVAVVKERDIIFGRRWVYKPKLETS